VKVIQHLNHLIKLKRNFFTFEILPPVKGKNINDILRLIEQLALFNPPWINVTSHASSVIETKDDKNNNIKKKYHKRPGTMGICGIIQNKFAIDAVAHILCQGFSRDETENLLIELNYLGVDNVLALKGDNLNYNKEFDFNKTSNYYASDLIQQINLMKSGVFIDHTDYNPIDFCVGAAGYPEKHVNAINLDSDIQFLKQKITNGAEYIVTQMFFDNSYYYNFVKKCRLNGITVPIIPGLKVLKSLNQINNLPGIFNVTIPDKLKNAVQENPNAVETICAQWAQYQIEDLFTNGVNGVHLYVMNDFKIIHNILRNFSH